MVLVEGRPGLVLGLIGVAGQDRVDVFRSADAAEELVDAQPVGPVEPGAGLGHHRQVRRAGRGVRREVVGFLALAVLARFLVDDRELLGIGPHLVLRQVWPAFVGKRADRDVFQPVAGRADLGIDLQPALQLVFVEGAERPLEREGHVLDTGTLGRESRPARQGKDGSGGDCDRSQHLNRSFPLIRPDGCWRRNAH